MAGISWYYHYFLGGLSKRFSREAPSTSNRTASAASTASATNVRTAGAVRPGRPLTRPTRPPTKPHKTPTRPPTKPPIRPTRPPTRPTRDSIERVEKGREGWGR